MSKYDAEQVQELLERAKMASKPLKDPALEKKIGEAHEHVVRKLDPKTGG